MSSYIPFVDVLCDNTRFATKIERTEYLETGDYIIIDQGKKDVAGYNNNAQGLYKDVPAIIFGDHTRVIKYVDKPCYIGADGVKLLGLTTKSKNSFDYKFLYYFLATQNIPDTGYNRHFKWLKDVNILNIPLSSQTEIAEVLDKASELVALRKRQLTELDTLAESVFYDMFGDPVTNPKGWQKKKLNKIGLIERGKSKHRPRNAPQLLGGKYPLIQTGDVANAELYITNYNQTYSEIGLAQSRMWKIGTLCITIAANIAKTAILEIEACFPDSIVGFTNNEESNSIFVHFWFSFFQEIIEKQAPEVAQKNINLAILSDLDIILPPLELQCQFATIIEKIEEQKAKVKVALKESEDLFQRLMQDMFNPEYHKS